MNDRELLELSAKAAGVGPVIRFEDGGLIIGPNRHSRYWNPLTDYADRHRLLVVLRMTMAHEPSRGGWSVGAVLNGEFKWLASNDDEARAIVRAAAEIGRKMK